MNFVLSHLGAIAGSLSFLAYIKYIASTIQGKTKPSKSSWWILTFVGILIFSSSYTLNTRESIWIQISYIIGPLIISILSLFPQYGYGSKLLKIDKVCILGSALVILVWVIFNSPLLAFWLSILVDFVGIIPTIKKSYIDPNGEDRVAWLMEAIAGLLNALGITAWFSFVYLDWVYGLYLLLLNGFICFLLWKNIIKKKIPYTTGHKGSKKNSLN